MTVERAAVVLAWGAGLLLGVGAMAESLFVMAAGSIVMLVVEFGLGPMFHDVKDQKGDSYDEGQEGEQT